MHDLGGRRIVKSVCNGQRARDLFTGLTEEIRKASVGTHGSSESLHAPASRIVMSRRPATRAVVPKGRSTHSPGWSATVKRGTRGPRRLTRHQPPRGDTGHCNSQTIEHNTLSGGSIGHIKRSRSINISGIKPSATDKWLHYDQVGSVMLATNASAAVADTRHADTFGNEMASWTSGARTDSLAERSSWGHNTKELDGDTGLVYMYQRWYSGETGTFMSEAPYPQWREHSYIAFASNPIQASDPLGLELVPIAPGDVPSDTPVPPGYDPDTWQPFRNPKLGVPPGRKIQFKDPSGNRWCPHPEDGDHYPHWDVRRKGSQKWINIPSRPGDPVKKPDPAPYWGPTGKDLLPLLLIPPLLTPVPGDEVIIYGAIRCLA